MGQWCLSLQQRAVLYKTTTNWYNCNLWRYHSAYDACMFYAYQVLFDVTFHTSALRLDWHCILLLSFLVNFVNQESRNDSSSCFLYSIAPAVFTIERSTLAEMASFSLLAAIFNSRLLSMTTLSLVHSFINRRGKHFHFLALVKHNAKMRNVSTSSLSRFLFCEQWHSLLVNYNRYSKSDYLFLFFPPGKEAIKIRNVVANNAYFYKPQMYNGIRAKAGRGTRRG